MCEDWSAEGLGLAYGTVGLTPARESWQEVGRRVVVSVEQLLGDRVVAVEHVGSTTVAGLMAKPIVDIAIGVRPGGETDGLIADLVEAGFDYRGDAGEEGGLVLVLEDGPRRRVVHLHLVESGGTQWRRYLEFRDLLRSNAAARTAYADTKVYLADRFPDDAAGYTAAKTQIVRGLLGDDDR